MKLYNLLYIICVAFLFQGCINDEGTSGEEPAGEDSFEIELSGNSNSQGDTELSRALSDFPNNQKIGVVAANNNSPVDWTSYPVISNATATAYEEEDGRFYFKFDTVRYWPFDGGQLLFLAYSPVANGTTVALTSDNTGLNIELADNMPDVMYASHNLDAETTPLSKTDKTVDLGEFRHILSKVTLRVLPAAVINPNVRLEYLVLRTRVTSATFNLLAGESSLDPATPAITPVEYVLVNTTTDIRQNNGFTKSIILLPGSEDYTEVQIRFSDRSFTFDKTYDISDFINTNGSDDPIRFVQGVNSTLQFTVSGIQVDHPEDAIHLEGQLMDWNERPDLQVIID